MSNTTLKKSDMAFRQDVLDFTLSKYGTNPEYLWSKLPLYAALRNEKNKKWYGLIMNVSMDRLGMRGKKSIDILEVRCDPMLSSSLIGKKGFLPAYHMKSGNWIVVLLNGTVKKEEVFFLLEMSYNLSQNKNSSKNTRIARNREWIVPVNPKYYDLKKAFEDSSEILWKQSNHICVGDTVYLYVASPISAILYSTKVLSADIPYEYNDGNVHMSHVMKLKKLGEYAEDKFTLNKLREHGVNTVRGPRSVPYGLKHELEKELV